MMLVLMKMILKILFMSDLWLGVIDLSNAKHLSKKKTTLYYILQDGGIGAYQKMMKKK